MNIKHLFLMFVIAGLMLAGCNRTSNEAADPVDFVNPCIGNISHLLVPTYPTVHLPNSMMRVYPERTNYTGELLRGLPLIVPGHRRNSAFNLSPYQGKPEHLKPVMHFSYDLEKVTPYSYSVYLDGQGTAIEFAPSHQSGIYRFVFAGNENIYLMVNSANGEMRWDGKAVSGYQQLSSNTKVYIYMEPEILPLTAGILKDNVPDANSAVASGRNACVVLAWPPDMTSLGIRYGISFISEEQAKIT
jgi:hypothetical protein